VYGETAVTNSWIIYCSSCINPKKINASKNVKSEDKKIKREKE
jgi:hypothetical protein